MNIEHDTLSSSEVLIKVKVQPQDYQQGVAKRLAKLQRELKLPGFRHGFVPPGHIERLYGDQLRVEELQKQVGTTLQTYIETQKFKPFGQPILQKSDIDWRSPFELHYVLGLLGGVSLDRLAKITLETYEVALKPADIEEAVSSLQHRFGAIESLEEVAEGSLVSLAIQLKETQDRVVLDLSKAANPKPLLKQPLGAVLEIRLDKLYAKGKTPAALKRL